MKKPGKIAGQLLRSLFKKPATIDYPAHRSKMPQGFRGRLTFHPELCIGCRLCMRDCPAGALEIIKKDEKKFEAVIHLNKCIYCGQCVDSCLKHALEMTDAFELAQLDPSLLTITINDDTQKNST